MRRVAPNQVPNSSESRFIDRQGNIRNILINVALIPGTKKSVASITDITDFKQMEKEIVHLDRLKLVGEMAAGIAHEIRNPMTTVRGLLQYYQSKKEFEQNREHFDLMIEELDRANSIITEYLSVAKNKSADLKLHNFNQIVETLLPLIQADAMNSNKYIQLELSEIVDLLLDEKDIRQLIINLVRNGLEAMSPGGHLTIRTFTDDDEVVLSVQDQGLGIRAPDLAKNHGLKFMKSTFKTNEDIARSYFSLSQKGNSTTSLAFMLYKIGLEGKTELQKTLLNSKTHFGALRDKLINLKNWLMPPNNFRLVKFLLNVPSELEVKVRIYELTGSDLENYHPTTAQEINLGYEWIKFILADFIKAHHEGKITLPQFTLNRSSYIGEVVVWSGTNDQTFDSEMGHLISDSYPHAKFALFNDSHIRQKYSGYYRSFRKAFFTYGLDSAQIESYFNDERQLNK